MKAKRKWKPGGRARQHGNAANWLRDRRRPERTENLIQLQPEMRSFPARKLKRGA